jgi:hypothetical protein
MTDAEHDERMPNCLITFAPSGIRPPKGDCRGDEQYDPARRLTCRKCAMGLSTVAAKRRAGRQTSGGSEVAAGSKDFRVRLGSIDRPRYCSFPRAKEERTPGGKNANSSQHG